MFRILIFALVLFGSPQHALALDCAEIAALSRIVTAQRDLLSGSEGLSETLARLDGDMARLDVAVVDRADERLPPDIDRDALRSLADLAHQISLARHRRDTQAVAQLLDNAAATGLFLRAGRTLSRLHCGQAFAAARALSHRPTQIGDMMLQDNHGAGGVPERRIGYGTALVGGLGVVVLSMAAAVLVWRFRSRQRRRARRFRILRDIDFHMQDNRYRGTLLDLSCLGAKLRHDGVITQQDVAVAVTLLGVVRPCKVTWLNDHYAGLQFAERLRIAQVLGVAAGIVTLNHNPTPQTQTAPASGGRA